MRMTGQTGANVNTIKGMQQQIRSIQAELEKLRADQAEARVRQLEEEARQQVVAAEAYTDQEKLRAEQIGSIQAELSTFKTNVNTKLDTMNSSMEEMLRLMRSDLDSLAPLGIAYV